MFSILFDTDLHDSPQLSAQEPDYFADLNLDQVVETITAGREEYRIKPFFYSPLASLEQIRYRHEIFQDLENRAIFACVNTFKQQMRLMRKHLEQAGKLHYRYQERRWFLDAVHIYCESVSKLLRDLAASPVRSRGFKALCRYLENYCGSHRFLSLVDETKTLLEGLATVRYCVHLHGKTIEVRPYESQPDYTTEIEEVFAKFKHRSGKDYLCEFPSWPEMNHVEANILELVARIYPDLFQDLDDYRNRNSDYLDETIAAFDRQVQFYTAYLEYRQGLERAGLPFCYPTLSREGKEIRSREGFDIALAHQLTRNGAAVVTNDFFLRGRERIIVITGPNQGGKTTFARAFGQIHYLAALGCPVPGTEAQLLLFDRLFTHFEKEEKIQDLRGKLQDDLVRIRTIVEHSTPRSIVIVNEIFSSTTLQDAVFLGRKVLESFIDIDLISVWVTFLDELASLSPKTVSMVSTVDPENPVVRTFKIVRRPADGLAYALSLAEKHRLTYDRIKERLPS